MINGNLPYVYLGSAIVSVPKHLASIASLIKGVGAHL
jgi:hypothetical protein